MAHSSWLWLAPRPAPGSAMVLSATLRTVLSSTIAIRLVIRTPRMTHRRRYTLRSVSARGATPEAVTRGETPGASMFPLQVFEPVPWLLHPGASGSARPRQGQQYGTGPYRKTFPILARHLKRPPGRVHAARRGYPGPAAAWHAEGVRGRHTGATRQE